MKCTLQHCPKDAIPVQKSWLKRLYSLSVLVRKDQEEWYEGENPLMPESVSMLIGFASSAETILELNKPTKES